MKCKENTNKKTADVPVEHRSKKGMDIMSVKFEFRMSDRNFNKLRLLKRVDDPKSEMTFNDFAEEILVNAISRIYCEYDRKGLIEEDDDE